MQKRWQGAVKLSLSWNWFFAFVRAKRTLSTLCIGQCKLDANRRQSTTIDDDDSIGWFIALASQCRLSSRNGRRRNAVGVMQGSRKIVKAGVEGRSGSLYRATHRTGRMSEMFFERDYVLRRVRSSVEAPHDACPTCLFEVLCSSRPVAVVCLVVRQ